jgi:hypothetical protein
VSVNVDFGITDPGLFQSTGVDVSWDITWSPVDDTHFVAVSFFSNFGGSQLVRVSESFSTDQGGTQHVGEVVRASESLGTDFVSIRFAVIVAPGH